MPVAPAFSVVLATDTFATIRVVIDHLRAQTMRDQIELVLVAPSRDLLREAEALRAEFAAVQVLECPLIGLGAARALAVRHCTAPFVFIGETHTFANAECAEALTQALSEGWATATPCFENANPDRLLSWAAFLSDYGRWAAGVPVGEIHRAPAHNTAYRREVLLAVGDGLAAALTREDSLWRALRAAGARSCLVARARLAHANVSQPWHWARERYCVGLHVATGRAAQWPWWKRLVYAGGAPLLPFVLTARAITRFRQASVVAPIPAMALPAVFAGNVIWAIGEAAGYLGQSARLSNRWMFEYELRKAAYTYRYEK